MQLLLVDDYALYRDSLVIALRARAPWIEIEVCATTDEAEALLCIDVERFDLVVVDYELAGVQNGLEWAEGLRVRFPTLPCALLSGTDDPRLETRTRRGGLAAFLSKGLDVPEIILVLVAVAAGDVWFPGARADCGREEATRRTARRYRGCD